MLYFCLGILRLRNNSETIHKIRDNRSSANYRSDIYKNSFAARFFCVAAGFYLGSAAMIFAFKKEAQGLEKIGNDLIKQIDEFERIKKNGDN